jgi:hypothetical protein
LIKLRNKLILKYFILILNRDLINIAYNLRKQIYGKKNLICVSKERKIVERKIVNVKMEGM